MITAAQAVPEIRHTSFDRAVARNVALQRAADFVGQAKLAAGLGIAERTLRSYLSAERGLPPLALEGAAAVLDRHAADVTALAERLRALTPTIPIPNEKEPASGE